MGHKSQDTKSETTPELLPFNAKEITMVKTSLLIPYANNARTHSDAQIKQIAASIQSFGFTNPVLIDASNGIIAGHGRVIAAEMLGLTEVPTICLTHLSNAAKRAYILADNRIAINSGWDMDVLPTEIQRIMDDGIFDVGDLGFDSAEVDEMLASNIQHHEGLAEDVLYEQSIQLEPSKEYIIIMAETPEEWDEMISYYGLELRERGGYAKGSPMYKVSRERVLTFGRAKDAGRNTEQG